MRHRAQEEVDQQQGISAPLGDPLIMDLGFGNTAYVPCCFYTLGTIHLCGTGVVFSHVDRSLCVSCPGLLVGTGLSWLTSFLDTKPGNNERMYGSMKEVVGSYWA
jgi:hypothetical protein